MKTTVAAQRNIFRELVRRFADQHEDNTDFLEILVDARIALAQFTDVGEDVAKLEHYDTKPYSDLIVREVREYRCSRCLHHATDHDSFCRECGGCTSTTTTGERNERKERNDQGYLGRVA